MTNKLNEEKRIQEVKNKQNQKKKEEDHLLEINGFKEEWYDIYGDRFINLSYSEGNIIPNTFKKGKPNYIEELGDINEGKDYDKYDTNVYDLYIPYSSYKRKQKHNGIMLFVRGGGFENNTKEEVECFAIRFAKLGFITANIEYTNSLDKYKQKGFIAALDAVDAGLQKEGLPSLKENADSSLSGNIKGITENTADLLASYLNAIRADVSVNRMELLNIRDNYLEDIKTQITSASSSLQNIENHTAAIMQSNATIAEKITNLDNNITGLKNRVWQVPVA